LTRDGGQARNERKLLKKHDQILQSRKPNNLDREKVNFLPNDISITDHTLALVGPQTEKSTFLGLLPPMTNQDEHISEIKPIHRDDPKLYWIFHDMDFMDWESTNGSQVLWLFGPRDRGITEVASHLVGLANEKVSQTKGAVFYFFCSAAEIESSVATTFTSSFLRHILNGSGELQAKSIATTFVSTLLLKILYRDSSRFHKGDSSITNVKKILKASGGELLEALTEAIGDLKEIQYMSFIIDRIDRLGKEGVSFVNRYLEKTKETPECKAFITSLLVSDIKELVNWLPCIEYDKERKGMDKHYAPFPNLESS
jgi:hypothetical protein